MHEAPAAHSRAGTAGTAEATTRTTDPPAPIASRDVADQDSTPANDAKPFVYPEPVYHPGLVDGAAFLYFDEPLMLTLAPAPTFAGGGFEVDDWVRRRRPEWGHRFLALSDLWGQESDGSVEMMKLLEPIRRSFHSALIATPGDHDALDRAAELIRAANLDRERMGAVVDPRVAAGELMNHLYLEMWLTLNEDAEALYAYAAELFSDIDRLRMTLERAYFLRVAHIPPRAPFNPLLLNNSDLIPFLLELPGGDQQKRSGDETMFSADVASWELFRQLLRPYLDPLTPESVEIIDACLRDRMDEVDALKRQTERLAEEVSVPDEPLELIADVERFIRLHVADELAELLRLNADAKQRFIDALLGDRAAWVATLAAAHGAMQGSTEWTVGGALGAIATIASKGYTTLAERRRTLARSDYRLIYNMAR